MARKSDWIIGLVLAFFGIGFVFVLFTPSENSENSITSFSIGEKIGVVKIIGGIFNSEPINKQINKLRKDKSIKAIVVRIDSPGGGVGASQEIYTEVLKAKEIKPVVISMGSVAASGGYYVASAGTKIVANPGTITGSIGVIAEFPYTEKFWDEKLNIKFNVLKSGKYKDSGSPVRQFTKDDSLALQGLIMDSYEQFVEAISTSRKMPVDTVYSYANGGVFTGRQALALGFVDELGNFEDAVKIAAELSGISGEPTLYEYKDEEELSLWNLLTGDASVLINRILTKTELNPVLQYKLSF
ncbi:signal peptide peptidase SppA [bacterium]|nr:signal peptide peptidase SppA [bacterium]